MKQSSKLSGSNVPTQNGFIADNFKDEFTSGKLQKLFTLTFVPDLSKLIVSVNGIIWQQIRYINPSGNDIELDTELSVGDYIIFKQ